MPKIAISTSSFAAYAVDDAKNPLQRLKSLGYEVRLNPHGRVLTEEETIELAKDCVGLIAGTESLNRNVLCKLPELRVISRCGIGLNTVDLVAANELGIQVYNTPDAPTEAAAELTIALSFALLRHIAQKDAQIKSGIWKKSMGFLLRGKNVGLVGFGRVGQAVGKLFTALGCHVAYTDPYVQNVTGFTYMPFDALLGFADVLSVHSAYPPIDEEQNVIFTAQSFASMRDGAWFINTARGELVDEEALYMALKSGKLAGAALDVFQKEPYAGSLTTLETIILHPHSASYALEARMAMENLAVANLLKALS